MANPELFREYAAQVLARVYAQHPVGIAISVAEDYPEIEPKNHEIFLCTVGWLITNGFLDADTVATRVDKNFHGVCLTLRGLSVLDAVPAELQEGKPSTLGQILRRKVEEGAAAVAGEMVKKALIELGSRLS
ncbi:hypothetical protein [Geothrix sp. 21YS21S-4]|uniref:hypothetical protein n=1 Tax=Geothrix sp. 21YS21S-4 TaxID=3068889 RepID=UPI0027BA9936|nr:hypothetical protein [Geothrix sp. 21YS21S-4]